MPSIDLTPYYQPQGSTSDGTKYDNGLALIQSTLNAVDNNNIATNAAIAASKLAGLATVLGAQNVGSANTDLQGPGASRSDLYVVTTGGGTLRSIGAPTENGSRVIIRNNSGSSITLKHQLAGGTGAQLFMRSVADVTLLDKELADFVYDGTNWVEVNLDQAAGAGASTQKLFYAGMQVSTPTSAIWETANAAILVPFTIQAAQTIAALIVSKGSANSGNFDVGVYDAAGNRKVSKGSTAQTTLTVSVANSVSVGATALAAGQYYLALAADNTTGAFALNTSATDGDPARFVQLKVATSFPLPASLTPGSTNPASAIPLFAPLT